MSNLQSRHFIQSRGMEATDIVKLNVGGTSYATTRGVLTKDPLSKLGRWFQMDVDPKENLPRDNEGCCFIDRDGYLFRFILDYLRCGAVLLPDKFSEKKRLACEAQFYGLKSLADELGEFCVNSTGNKLKNLSPQHSMTKCGCYITVGYQGTFYFGPQGLPAGDVNFRKIMRIMVSGRVNLCREVFKESLNEARDPDRGHSYDRYTSRFYLKHNVLEQAFDMLSEANFTLVCSCASGTSGSNESKPSSNTEEDRWAHYSEFIFHR